MLLACAACDAEIGDLPGDRMHDVPLEVLAALPDLGHSTPVVLPGELQLGLSASQLTLRLNESKSVKLTLTPSDGFSGDVALSIAGLPAGVTATFDPPHPAITAAPVEVTLSLSARPDMIAPPAMPLSVVASSNGRSSKAPLMLDLVDEVLIIIAQGVDTSSVNETAFGGTAQTSVVYVAPGTKVTFLNLDTVDHEIHPDDSSTGLQHEPGPMHPNETYSQVLTQGSVTFRCHIHPNMVGKLVVQ